MPPEIAEYGRKYSDEWLRLVEPARLRAQRSFNNRIPLFFFIWLAGGLLGLAQSSDLFATLPKQQVLGVQVTRELDLKGITIPLGEPNAGVMLRCAQVRVVSKQMGQMKIGLIPALEVSGMSWEIRGGIPAPAWCGLVTSFFQSEPLLAQSTIQGFFLAFDRAKKFRLDAKAAFYNADLHSLRLEKTILEIDGQQFPYHRAEILLVGERAGQLVLANGKNRRICIQLPVEILPPALQDKFTRTQ